MRVAVAVAALLSVAVASEAEWNANRNRRSVRAHKTHRFANAEVAALEAAEADTMQRAELEAIARANNLHVVRGRLHLFSEAHVEEAEAILERNRGAFDFFKNAASRAANAFKTTWADLKAKFQGLEQEWSTKVDYVLGLGEYNTDTAKDAVVTVIGETRKAEDPAVKKSMLESVGAWITAQGRLDTLDMFCRGFMCLWEPEYDSCTDVSPFKEIKADIEEGDKAINDANRKWSAVIKHFLKKAVLRITIHLMAVIVRAAKVALDSVPGGAYVESFFGGIHEMCDIIASGNKGPGGKVGSQCFLLQIKKGLDLVQKTVRMIANKQIKELLAEFTNPNAIPSFGTTSLVTCMVRQTRINISDDAKCKCAKKIAAGDDKARDASINTLFASKPSF